MYTDEQYDKVWIEREDFRNQLQLAREAQQQAEERAEKIKREADTEINRLHKHCSKLEDSQNNLLGWLDSERKSKDAAIARCERLEQVLRYALSQIREGATGRAELILNAALAAEHEQLTPNAALAHVKQQHAEAEQRLQADRERDAVEQFGREPKDGQR
jgi:hypothetical protein